MSILQRGSRGNFAQGKRVPRHHGRPGHGCGAFSGVFAGAKSTGGKTEEQTNEHVEKLKADERYKRRVY
jgi:hypothetical protein